MLLKLFLAHQVPSQGQQTRQLSWSSPTGPFWASITCLPILILTAFSTDDVWAAASTMEVLTGCRTNFPGCGRRRPHRQGLMFHIHVIQTTAAHKEGKALGLSFNNNNNNNKHFIYCCSTTMFHNFLKMLSHIFVWNAKRPTLQAAGHVTSKFLLLLQTAHKLRFQKKRRRTRGVLERPLDANYKQLVSVILESWSQSGWRGKQ